MAFSQQHLEILSEMGIPVWVRRSSSAAQAETPTHIENAETTAVTSTALPETRWLICVESTELTSAEMHLLKAICQACRIPVNDWALITQAQIAELPGVSDQSRRVLCLASNLWSSIQSVFATTETQLFIVDAMHLIASPSLAEMLADTRAKALLWSRLKAYARPD